MSTGQDTALSAPLIGLSRHRLATDGKGVTTLVAFHGCTLRCRYCLNPHCLDPEWTWRSVTPQELLDEVMLDNLYFLATGGGVTFGGGEPCLRSEFIAEFCQIAPKEWNITLETALNVPRKHVERIARCVDHFFVDVKDLNPATYSFYTSRAIDMALDNLKWLLSQSGMAERITVRVPLIPHVNSLHDTEKTIAALHKMGVRGIDRLTYILREDGDE